MKNWKVTDKKSKHFGATLRKVGYKFGIKGEKVGLLLELEDFVGKYSEGFLFEQIQEVAEPTDSEKQAYYHQLQVDEYYYTYGC